MTRLAGGAIASLALALVLSFASATTTARASARLQAPAGIPPCPSRADAPDVAALVERIELLLNGRSSVGVMTMAIRTPSWSRSLKLKVWAEGKDYALLRVLEGGPRETGMMTLKREKQIWNWLPQAGRVMKLPSGMMGDSWMGSDFTNDDLVRGTSLADDFESKVAGVEPIGGRDAWHVILTPKPDAVIVWGRIEMLIDRKTCLPVTERFYDEDGELAREMRFSDVRTVGWRQFPAKMTVVPAEVGRETSITYSEIEFDVDLPDDTFSLQRLRQGR
ncbi:MAG: outer membrane lipoprotein-sorting protein [Acidobacteria bacterium]|nr:MAG: outer membrane lipoprotein-sorting protein [Acidobacteriota bacterium]